MRPAALDVRALMNPLPKQQQFLDALYAKKYVLYGGSAGPGKSYALRWGAADFVMECFGAGLPGVRVMLASEDYPTLRDRQIARIRREFPPYMGTLKRSEAEGYGFYFHEKYGGGTIALRNLDDPSKYASSEFGAIFVEELTKNPRQTFDDLRFRMRWPGLKHTVFGGATNPGGIGHGWVKKVWLDNDFSGIDSVLDPDDFAFIRALPRDNPYLTDDYWEILDSLPEKMRKALRDGDWSIFEGQVFSEFAELVHIKEPFPIPANWARWVSLDYGYDHPTAAYWHARGQAGDVIHVPGRGPTRLDQRHTVTYREYFIRQRLAQDQAKDIRDLSKGERISLVVGSPDMWAHRGGHGDQSIADEFMAAGVAITQANNDRVAGVGRMHRALEHDIVRVYRGEVTPDMTRIKAATGPEWWIFKNCTNLIRVLPTMVSDPIRPEDVLKMDGDDPYESARYGLMAADEMGGVGTAPSTYRITSTSRAKAAARPRQSTVHY